MSETDGPESTSADKPAWATTGATAATPSPAADGDAPPAEKKARPAWLLPAAIVAGVVVVGGIVVAIVTSGGDDETAAPVATPTVVVPSPTPTATPAERPDPTGFTSALPASVLQYAFVEEKAAGDWLKADALEAVTDTYSDGGTGTLVVDAGQFATAKEATAFAKALLEGDGTANAGLGLPAAGEVSAGGEKAGAFVLQDAGDGTGVAVWTNGTSVFRLTTAVADVTNAYNAFPL
ncbi:hypothetical protein [Cellulomonas sp. PhB150]|uniref:hypothetical protein n=1 Tax=Cellulomonas sp. PhB150 TaxID=2485188 RepID=UPI000F905631|nr:hypothetical protein [Cellulomonas sp. PhB150]ROS25965.1 hypothetical protein EDF34_2291 [Cellulomonas sp. PhB150]